MTERCVMRLTPEGVTVIEIAPGVDLERDILGQAEFPLRVADGLKMMDAALVPPRADRPAACAGGAAPGGWPMSGPHVHLAFEGPIARIVLRRPEKLNALDGE